MKRTRIRPLSASDSLPKRELTTPKTSLGYSQRSRLSTLRSCRSNNSRGVGPYGERQLVKLVAGRLNRLPRYQGRAATRRTPDLLIAGEWAIEFKLVRPYGDNGKEAENWSVNLLHPYPGNVSAIGDCFKLREYSGPERRAVVAVGYEHVPCKIDLTPLVRSFEAVCAGSPVKISDTIEVRRSNLVHPVHQCVRLFGDILSNGG